MRNLKSLKNKKDIHCTAYSKYILEFFHQNMIGPSMFKVQNILYDICSFIYVLNFGHKLQISGWH